MFQHKDIKMIALHALRKKPHTLERLLLSAYIICVPFCTPVLSADWIMTAYKAICANAEQKRKREESTQVLHWLLLMKPSVFLHQKISTARHRALAIRSVVQQPGGVTQCSSM